MIWGSAGANAARVLAVVCLLVPALACGDDGKTDEGLGTIGGIDTSVDGLTKLVMDGGYQGWLAEPAPHPTEGPHGKNVRVFFNDALVASLQAGNSTHPVGAAMTKELYDGDDTMPSGQAFGIKVAEGTAADSWLWFEAFAPAYEAPFYGRALQPCAGCHELGTDFVLSPLP